eukprot:scaffold240195_cov17-Tisochrysis_lutea.AAC.3
MGILASMPIACLIAVLHFSTALRCSSCRGTASWASKLMALALQHVYTLLLVYAGLRCSACSGTAS